MQNLVWGLFDERKQIRKKLHLVLRKSKKKSWQYSYSLIVCNNFPSWKPLQNCHHIEVKPITLRTITFPTQFPNTSPSNYPWSLSKRLHQQCTEAWFQDELSFRPFVLPCSSSLRRSYDYHLILYSLRSFFHLTSIWAENWLYWVRIVAGVGERGG